MAIKKTPSLSRFDQPLNPKPSRDGVKTPSAPPVAVARPRGKSASAPGQLKKVAGVQSAKTFTKGYKKR